MTKREDDTNRELNRRTDGGTVVTESGETPADAARNSVEEEIEKSSAVERHVEADPVQIDQVFDILKNQRRRAVLRYLRTVEDEVTLGTLAEQIAAWECEKDVSLITSSERKRVYVGLYQCHLPKMDDVGAIAYNKPRGKIERGENSELFEHYLPTETDAAERPWTEYYWALPLVVGLLALVVGLVLILA